MAILLKILLNLSTHLIPSWCSPFIHPLQSASHFHIRNFYYVHLLMYIVRQLQITQTKTANFLGPCHPECWIGPGESSCHHCCILSSFLIYQLSSKANDVFFFFRVLHTIFSHLRAHVFARSVTVARSSAVQASSSRRQERRWAIGCGSPQSQSTDWASSR